MKSRRWKRKRIRHTTAKSSWGKGIRQRFAERVKQSMSNSVTRFGLGGSLRLNWFVFRIFIIIFLINFCFDGNPLNLNLRVDQPIVVLDINLA